MGRGGGGVGGRWKETNSSGITNGAAKKGRSRGDICQDSKLQNYVVWLPCTQTFPRVPLYKLPPFGGFAKTQKGSPRFRFISLRPPQHIKPFVCERALLIYGRRVYVKGIRFIVWGLRKVCSHKTLINTIYKRLPFELSLLVLSSRRDAGRRKEFANIGQNGLVGSS